MTTTATTTAIETTTTPPPTAPPMIAALLLLDAPVTELPTPEGPVTVLPTAGTPVTVPPMTSPVAVPRPPDSPDPGGGVVGTGLGGVSFLEMKVVVHCAEYMLYTTGVAGNTTFVAESSHDTPTKG